MNSIVQFGFHYFDDLQHFTQKNLNYWMTNIGGNIQWIVLKSSCYRAIPEVVLQFCAENNLNVLVQFDFAEWQAAPEQEFADLLSYYRKQGIAFIQLDGAMNMRGVWAKTHRANTILRQIADVVLAFQQIAETFGFSHVLPKMIPGGDYWDLVVLRYVLQQLREQKANLDLVVLSFLAWFNQHPVLWGRGGKEKWTERQPYQEGFSGEDHRGFMGFEWYQEIANEELGRQLPVLLLEVGDDFFADEHATVENLTSLSGLIGKEQNAGLFSKVLGLCFAYPQSGYADATSTFFTEQLPEPVREKTVRHAVIEKEKPVIQRKEIEKSISHYLLLPQYNWGISPWHLEVALPFIRKFKPTIGYSLQEAMHARFVTVVMDEDVFSRESLQALRKNGCKLTIIQGDGTEIAAKLAVE